MRKFLSINLLFVLLALCGCNDGAENKETRFLLDTIVSLQADCDDKTLEEAFELCAQYEKILSRTAEESDVFKINNLNGAVEVSKDTSYLVKRSLYYSELTNGAFDITIAPVSMLWDFSGDVVPDRSEIAAALRSVDYHSVSVDGDIVNTNGKKIDLGAIAKGYIADKLRDYLTQKGATKGIVNLGGNVAVFGEREYRIGIKKPFSGEQNTAQILVGDGYSVITSGTYERYIEKDGVKYHHILDPKTGYGVETDLVSATIIGKNGADCDALSTVCILLGYERAKELIDGTADTEAIFITDDGKVSHTAGLSVKNNVYTLNVR